MRHNSEVAKDANLDAVDSVKNQPIEKLLLHYKKFEGLARKVGGSGNIFLKLFRDRDANDTFWLDSSSTDQVLNPYGSFFYFKFSIVIDLL